MDLISATFLVILIGLILIVAFWPKFKTSVKWSILGAAAFLILLVLYIINDALSYHWPVIADAVKIRHEATVLWQMANLPKFGPPWNPLETYDRIEISKQDWPEGIAALHPKQVVVVKDYVIVVTASTGRGGNQAWGYKIYIDGVHRRDGGIEKWNTDGER